MDNIIVITTHNKLISSAGAISFQSCNTENPNASYRNYIFLWDIFT